MKYDISSLAPNNRTVSAMQQPNKNIRASQDKSGSGFVDTLKGFMSDVNRAQNEAGESVNRLMTGEIKDVHDVMIAVQKAGTSFELLMEVRNKMIDTYREVMRMQV